MPNFELNEEYQALSDMVRDFADTVVAPVSAKHDAEHSFPYEIVAQMGELGLFGLPFPEELGRVDQSVAITLEAGVSLGAMPVFRFGTQTQQEQWLPELTSGAALAGFGLTEPDAGSDAGRTATRAQLVDGEWVIDGNKQFITNSGTNISKFVTVTAVTGTSERADGTVKKEISTIIAPNGTPGFTVEKPYNKVGWNPPADLHQRPRAGGKPAG